jgi:hypothetical protein
MKQSSSLDVAKRRWPCAQQAAAILAPQQEAEGNRQHYVDGFALTR